MVRHWKMDRFLFKMWVMRLHVVTIRRESTLRVLVTVMVTVMVRVRVRIMGVVK